MYVAGLSVFCGKFEEYIMLKAGVTRITPIS